MPIYEYHCQECNKDFECLVFGKEQPECPKCNNRNVNRIMSSCGFISKGSGGQTTTRSAGHSCGSCSSSSCGSCGH